MALTAQHNELTARELSAPTIEAAPTRATLRFVGAVHYYLTSQYLYSLFGSFHVGKAIKGNAKDEIWNRRPNGFGSLGINVLSMISIAMRYMSVICSQWYRQTFSNPVVKISKGEFCLTSLGDTVRCC